MARMFLYAGLALALVGLAVGKLGHKVGLAPATEELVMAEGDLRELDAATSLELKKFEMPTYASGKPRQYVSTVKVTDLKHSRVTVAEISVNHPFRVNGWWIYQYYWGHDENGTLCTSLRCVADRGLPIAALGGLLLLVGSALLCLRMERLAGDECRGWRRHAAWVAGTLTVALPLFIIGRAVMRPEPLPALQSWMMGPHVGAYVASYLILLFAVFGIGRRFVPLGFFFMTLGLVLGAVWGKFAWSEWWQFDPKENWSFVTWLAFAAYLHVPPESKAAHWLLRAGAILIIITLTWVNFAKISAGLHSYA